MDKHTNELEELTSIPQIIPEPTDFSEFFVGRTIGYYEILKKAGRNRSYQQRYIVRCNSCKQQFTKTMYEIRKAEGETTCRHTHKTTKAATEPHPCECCGEMTTNIRFCTARCKTIFINKATKTKPPKQCLVCGKPTQKSNHNYCSNECRRLHRLNTMYGFDIKPDDNKES